MSTFKPKTKPVVLFLGDTEAEINRLRNTYAREQRSALALAEGPRRQGDPGASAAVEAAAEEYNAYVAAAEADPDRSLTVTIQAIDRKAWRALIKDHPPRMEKIKDGEGKETAQEVPHAEDADWNFNFETLCDDLVPASVVEPEYKSDDFLNSLSIGQWNRLYGEAVELNTGLGVDPKVQLRSRTGQIFDETST